MLIWLVFVAAAARVKVLHQLIFAPSAKSVSDLESFAPSGASGTQSDLLCEPEGNV